MGNIGPRFVAVQKAAKGQYSPVQLKQSRLVSSLLCGTGAMLVLNLPAFENKKYIAYDLVMDFRFEYNQIITWSHKGVRG